MDKFAIMAEADRRGILPPEQKAMLDEAVKRGLVPAKRESMAAQATAGNLPEALTKAAYAAGGKVTDWLAGAGASPGVAAGAGFVTNVALEAVPALLGGGLGTKAAPLMEAAAQSSMKSALKPTLRAWQRGDAPKAVDTLLDEGINVTKGGVRELKSRIGQLNDEIAASLANSGATVDKGKVASTIQHVVNRIEKTNPTPQDALANVERVYEQFVLNKLVPNNIPVEQAQAFKQGIYKMLKDKYGTLASDTVEAQKALARGFKEEIASAVPAVSALNARESKLINALNVTERRVLMEANKNPMGLSLLAKNPAAWATFMADRSGAFKSVVARMLHSGQRVIPGTVGAGVGAVFGADSGTADE